MAFPFRAVRHTVDNAFTLFHRPCWRRTERGFGDSSAESLPSSITSFPDCLSRRTIRVPRSLRPESMDRIQAQRASQAQVDALVFPVRTELSTIFPARSPKSSSVNGECVELLDIKQARLHTLFAGDLGAQRKKRTGGPRMPGGRLSSSVHVLTTPNQPYRYCWMAA